jgi:hypothetical protein
MPKKVTKAMMAPVPRPRFARLESRDEVDATVISLAIPRELHRRVKAAGLAFNFSLSHIAREALTAWCDAHPVAPERGRR